MAVVVAVLEDDELAAALGGADDELSGEVGEDVVVIGGGGTPVEEVYIGAEEPEDESIKLWVDTDEEDTGGGSGGTGEDGEDGATFTPSVSEDGTLSWTNDKGLENPEPVNIMGPAGPAGADGAPGPQGPQGEPGPAGVIGTDLYVGERARLRTTDDSRGNLQLYNAAGQVTVNAYATENGIGELDVHDAAGAVKAALYANTAGEGVLKLKNAAGDAETLCHADIAALHGLPSAPVQMVRIWKNAAPSSGFANQSLAIDNLQDYDAIAISAQYYAGYGAGTTLLLPTTPGTKGALTVPYYYIAYRNVTVGENSLVFAQGEYRASIGGSPGADNSLIVPTEIYGYKGVS